MTVTIFLLTVTVFSPSQIENRDCHHSLFADFLSFVASVLEDYFAGLETALTPERYALIKEIFLKAVAVEVGQRESVIDEACGGDEELRREIESLLQYHFESDRPDSMERLH